MVYLTQMAFSNRLSSVRREQRISQSDLAAKVGLHTNALGRYERGDAIPSVEVAAKIAEALNISLDYLTGLIDVALDPVLLDRMNNISALSDADQEHLYKVIDALLRDAKKNSL